MYLVHPKKHGHGKWEVAWTWVPFFLAADKGLVEYVDQGLTKLFKGTDIESEMGEDLLTLKMHGKVIDLIMERYPIEGLRQYLSGLIDVHPEETE